MIKIQNFKTYDLEDRTLNFAKKVRTLVKQISKTITNMEDGKQVIKASGSVGASKYPPAKPGALRLLAPQRGLIAIDRNQN